MILYEGRNVLWKDRECVVLRCITRDRVLIAYASNPKVQRIVKVADLEKCRGGEAMGKELISRSGFRQKLIDRQVNYAFYDLHLRHEIGCIIELLDKEPAVPVVRCRDCIRRKTLRNGSHVCPYSTVDLDLNGFCARGKRKDDANGRK